MFLYTVYISVLYWPDKLVCNFWPAYIIPTMNCEKQKVFQTSDTLAIAQHYLLSKLDKAVAL
jgi:hypothetical protein